jgi:hypothetical protein
MNRHPAATARLIEAGLDRSRPYRSYCEVIAEHRALLALAKRVAAGRELGLLTPLITDAEALIARCSTPTQET